MRQFIFQTLLAVLLINVADAQVGVRAGYNANSFRDASEDLDPFFQEEALLRRGFHLGVDYWFRLKTRRVEFMPEVYFSTNHSSFVDEFITDMTLNRVGFNFNTQFYFLDFEEDCNCPTFSKQGPSVSKGFFFSLSPGVSYDMMKMSSTAGVVNANDHFNIKLGGGFGLDLGINDFLTLTPFYTYNYFIGADWTLTNYPGGTEPIITTNSSSGQHLFGMRVGLRFDY